MFKHFLLLRIPFKAGRIFGLATLWLFSFFSVQAQEITNRTLYMEDLSIGYVYSTMTLNPVNDGRTNDQIPKGFSLMSRIGIKQNHYFNLGIKRRRIDSKVVNGFVFNELGGFSSIERDRVTHLFIDMPLAYEYGIIKSKNYKLFVHVAGNLTNWLQEFGTHVSFGSVEKQLLIKSKNMGLELGLAGKVRLKHQLYLSFSQNYRHYISGPLKQLVVWELQAGLSWTFRDGDL